MKDFLKNRKQAKAVEPVKTVEAIANNEPLADEPPKKKRTRAEKKADIPERLPHNSRFDVTYSAIGKYWEGTLTVPQQAGEQEGFVTSARVSAVFKLLRHLDTKYRAWLASRES
jgi:pyocin large subunit-like protein